MLLNNLQLINSDKIIDIGIAGERIATVSPHAHVTHSFSIQLTFENAVVLPGLINSHDHLDFNLFPKLGNEVYNNYTEWAATIHKDYKKEIAEVLNVPEELRVQWGIYKNLLCGVTTVVNHGKLLPNKDYLITVLQNCQSLHSIAFEEQLKLKLNNPLNLNKAVAIHIGEGTYEFASNEIDQLTRWNLLKRKLVGIHGVAMNVEQAKKFKALVWCPASNYFMLNKTADINRLQDHTTICFGSDSTLTSDWNIWQHVNLARRNIGIKQSELLQMLTTNPANVWRLNGGAIEKGKDADIVVVRTPREGLLSNINPADILLVMHKGEICLFDESLFEQVTLNGFNQLNFSPVEINNSIKHVKGDLPQLMPNIKKYLPSAQFPCKAVARMAAI